MPYCTIDREPVFITDTMYRAFRDEACEGKDPVFAGSTMFSGSKASKYVGADRSFKLRFPHHRY